MIIGIAEGIVYLGRSQMGVGLPDHLHRITGLCALVDKAHWNAIGELCSQYQPSSKSSSQTAGLLSCSPV
jgi:hypothetical protein